MGEQPVPTGLRRVALFLAGFGVTACQQSFQRLGRVRLERRCHYIREARQFLPVPARQGRAASAR